MALIFTSLNSIPGNIPHSVSKTVNIGHLLVYWKNSNVTGIFLIRNMIVHYDFAINTLVTYLCFKIYFLIVKVRSELILKISNSDRPKIFYQWEILGKYKEVIWNVAVQVNFWQMRVFCLNYNRVQHRPHFNLIINHTKYFPTQEKLGYYS